MSSEDPSDLFGSLPSANSGGAPPSMDDNASSLPDNLSSLPESHSQADPALALPQDPIDDDTTSNFADFSSINGNSTLNISSLSLNVGGGLLSDDEDNEGIQQNSLVIDLERHFINEKCAPELLAPSPELIDAIKELIEVQSERIDDLQSQTTNHEEEDLSAEEKRQQSFLVMIYQIELDRIKFLYNGYLRLRIRKIVSTVAHLITDEDATQNLTEAEYQFAQGYADKFKDHLTESFLKDLPNGGVGTDLETDAPNNKRFRFFRVRDDLGHVNFDESNRSKPHEFKEGEIYVAPFNKIKGYVEEHKMDLL